MKIAVLTTSYPSDPADHAGNFIHNLLCALARRGHSLRVIVPARQGASGHGAIDGIPVWRFRYGLVNRSLMLTSVPGGIPEAIRRRPTAVLGLPGLLARFARTASRHAAWADLIYANWLGAALVGSIAGRRAAKPMVVTLRGDDAYLVRDRRLWRMTARRVFGRCAAVTVVSGNMAPLVEPYVPQHLRPVLAPAFGVDIEKFHPPAGAAGETTRKPSGLFVGNISRAKGVDTLIRALAECRSEWHGFAFVGGGEIERTQRLAEELGIGGSIEWAGRRGVGEIPGWMRRFDFLVLPSLSEGRPNVVLEAMATALPIIATSVGGIPELIADGQTGLLVPPGDAGRLADAIRRICADASLRDSLGRAGRTHVEQADLTWDRTAREMEEIFDRATRRS